MARGWRMPISLALALAALPAAAQVYKWTDAQGTVHYTDTPPPARKSSRLGVPAGAPGAALDAPLPYELARAAQASPVTLYTTGQCAGCDQGRALLRARGVPFVEKTVGSEQDKEALRQLSGKLELPLLVVGSRRVAGYQDAAWQDALNAAAYPRSSQLPRNYRDAAPQPAAGEATPPARAANPPPEEAAPGPAARPAEPPKPQPPADSAPPGFQF